MEISKVCLVGVISFLFISTAIGDILRNYEIKVGGPSRRGGSRRTPLTGSPPDPAFGPSTIDKSSTQKYGFNYDIKRLVPSSPSSIQFPPIEKPPTSTKRGGSRRTPLSRGPNPITTPNSLFKPSTQDKPTTQNYGINYDIKRLVPSGPSPIQFPPIEKPPTSTRRGGSRRTPLSRGPDPITTQNSPFRPSTQDKPTTQNYGINYDIKRLVPSGPSPIQFPPIEKPPTSTKRGGSIRTPLSRGHDPITTSNSPFKPSSQDKPTTQNYVINYDIKRLVPSGPSPIQFPPIEKPPTSTRRGGSRRTPLSKVPDPITTQNSPFKPSTLDKPTTQNYGFNYDIKRLVPSGPNSIPSPSFEKLSTPIRRGGPIRTPLSKGKDPITYPDPPPEH